MKANWRRILSNRRPFLKGLCLFFSLVLFLPNPALAMRSMTPVESGLEEDLSGALNRPSPAGLEDGRAILEELTRMGTDGSVALTTHKSIVQSDAGLSLSALPYWEKGRRTLRIVVRVFASSARGPAPWTREARRAGRGLEVNAVLVDADTGSPVKALPLDRNGKAIFRGVLPYEPSQRRSVDKRYRIRFAVAPAEEPTSPAESAARPSTESAAGLEEKTSRRRWAKQLVGALVGTVGGGILGDRLADLAAAGLADPLPGKLVAAQPRGPIEEIARKFGVNLQDDELDWHQLNIGRPQPVPDPRARNMGVRDDEVVAWRFLDAPAGVAHAVFWVPVSREDGGELTTERFDLLSIMLVAGGLPGVARFSLTVDTEKPIRNLKLGVFARSLDDLFSGPGPHSFDVPLVSEVQETYGAIRGLRVELWARDPAWPMKFEFRVRVMRTPEYAKGQGRRWVYRFLGGISGVVVGFEAGRRVSRKFPRSSATGGSTALTTGLEEDVPVEELRTALRTDPEFVKMKLKDTLKRQDWERLYQRLNLDAAGVRELLRGIVPPANRGGKRVAQIIAGVVRQVKKVHGVDETAFGRHAASVRRIVESRRWVELEGLPRQLLRISEEILPDRARTEVQGFRKLDEAVRWLQQLPAGARPQDPVQRKALERWHAVAVAFLRMGSALSPESAEKFVESPESLEGYVWVILDYLWTQLVQQKQEGRAGLNEIGKRYPSLVPAVEEKEAWTYWLDSLAVLRWATPLERYDTSVDSMREPVDSSLAMIGFLILRLRPPEERSVPLDPVRLKAELDDTVRQLGSVPMQLRRDFLLGQDAAAVNLSTVFYEAVSRVAGRLGEARAAEYYAQTAQRRYQAIQSILAPDYPVWRPRFEEGAASTPVPPEPVEGTGLEEQAEAMLADWLSHYAAILAKQPDAVESGRRQQVNLLMTGLLDNSEAALEVLERWLQPEGKIRKEFPPIIGVPLAGLLLGIAQRNAKAGKIEVVERANQVAQLVPQADDPARIGVWAVGQVLADAKERRTKQPSGLEEVRIVTTDELAAVDRELPARLGITKKPGVALLPVQAASAPLSQRGVHLFGHRTVTDAVITLLPDAWSLDRWEIFPTQNLPRANQLLEESIRSAEAGWTTVIALDPASLEGLVLRDGHPLALLLNPNPDVWKRIDPQALFAFVNQLAAKKNIVLDLSAGSIRVVEIPGWGEFYAIPLAQSA